MKAALIVLIILGFLHRSGICDTVDTWHVYHNGIKILEASEESVDPMILNLNTIGVNDSIVVYYYRDTPNPRDSTRLIVGTTEHMQLLVIRGVGIHRPLAFSLHDLARYGPGLYTVRYRDAQTGEREEPSTLFQIKLE